MKPTAPRPIRLKDYQPPSHLIEKTHLDVRLDPVATYVTAKLTIVPNPQAHRASTELRLDGENLKLDDLALDDHKLGPDDFVVTADSLTIRTVPDQRFRLRIVTRVNPDANTALQGLYRSNGIYCTQCEAEGFRRITYFLDRPDVLSIYTCRIEADVNDAPVLLANGNLHERGTLAGGKRHYTIWKDPHPKPAYLFALVGGNLTSIASQHTTKSGRQVDLTIYVEPGNEARCGWAMDSLKRAMAWDEERFGCEYDLDVFNIVAVADFNMGAMENKGLNIFNDRLILASPETATDAAYEAIESVVAHEYFHNWTGNRITCRDWFQLCLKEGLTVYRDQEFSADMRSRAVQRIADVRRLRAHQFPEDAGPMAHPVRPGSYIEINNFYTATVYEKGAELVRMIATILGHDMFGEGMALYLSRHDGEAATVEQFVACFAEVSGRDMSQFLNWYNQAGTPEVTCRLTHDKQRQRAEITLEQILPQTPDSQRKRALHIPIRVGFVASDGTDMAMTQTNGQPLCDGILHLTKSKQTFKFKNVTEKPVLSVLRGFSAPVRLRLERTERQLAFLTANDTDSFARWQANGDFALRLLIGQIRHADDTQPQAARLTAYAAALETVLTDTGLEPAYRAEFLRLPSEADIAREVQRNINPTAIHVARKTVLQALAKRLGPALMAAYDAAQWSQPYAPTAEQAGNRALRNTALTLLAQRNTAADRKRLWTHYSEAACMTDQAHALTLYAHSNARKRRDALEDFYERWKDNHLVVDTWFAVQATAPANATLNRVKALVRHPLYSATTPNKVRAVVGNFASQNPVQFNRPDGAGYAFVAKQVGQIDSYNPQVAARLLGAFRSWRSLEPGRRKLARSALKNVAATPQLSRDVYEIASKILGDDAA